MKFDLGKHTLFLVIVLIGILTALFFYTTYENKFFLSACTFLIGVLSSSKVLCYAMSRNLVEYKNIGVAVALLAIAITLSGLFTPLILEQSMSFSKLFTNSTKIQYNITALPLIFIMIIASLLTFKIKVIQKQTI